MNCQLEKSIGNISIGDVEINVLSGVITNKKMQLKFDRVGRREVKTLELLLDHENDVVSKIMLMDLVWGTQIVTENSLAVAMFNLRKLLKKYDEKKHYTLVNVSGYGYGIYSNNSF
ncbi:winged helix-turn-helix domain-containing protein [Moritella sp. F3]|uniref:winged helix-turn-helix domain-containing protein n=1 Tax=Moritella sp. F3 TaxID=2718882 RepID=UPI0018E11E21|nr:winged helix-turn-helix domain-containing protein [Moritella sp. F3]GIC81596.1 hypothetical protein FMO003_18770 [Moritella sp. F3]